MAPTEDGPGEEGVGEQQLAVPTSVPQKSLLNTSDSKVDEWCNEVDEVSLTIQSLLDGTVTDFDEFDRQQNLKQRAKEIRAEDVREKRERYILYGVEGKGEGRHYKWWCKRCFVEYGVDLAENKCTRCKQSDKMMTQEQRREELMGKLSDFKEVKVKHQFRKDKWLRWKKSQAMLKRSRNINYKAWEYWEPDTDSDEEGDPIVPRDNPEFLAMEADIKQKHKKQGERLITANRCRERGNECMKSGDFVGAIENYEEGLEYRRDLKAIWTNKALAEIKVFRWHDAIASCNKVIEYAEIFEDGFTKNPDACFKAFMRRATALRALQKWAEALEDIEDALKLFPKDREACDLYSKTKLAVQEAIAVKKLQGGDIEPDAASTQAATDDEAADEHSLPEPTQTAAPQIPSGPVRVEIEESDEEDEVVPAAHPDSLAGMSKRDFKSFMERLKSSAKERTLFCSRKQGDSAAYASKDQAERDRSGRKVVMKVEEVPDASGMDNLMKDCERCCILWKKHQGHVVPLRFEVEKISDPYEAAEAKEAWNFLEVTVPRVLDVLYLLASSSELHRELSAAAVRYVWPFLSSDEWRHRVLELLMEWSECPVGGRGLAEFASRYPKPHLELLIDAVAKEEKGNILPPNFEETARSASERLDKGEAGVENVLDEVLRGLTSLSPAEIAVSTLGNLCVSGHSLPAFKEQIAPYCDHIISALVRQLRPLDWRLCGRAAGCVANVLRLGSVFVDAVEEKCLEPLVTVLREDSKGKGGPMAMMQSLGLGDGKGLPFVRSTNRVLGALVNFLVIRPSALQRVRALGVLELVVPLMEVSVQASSGSKSSADEDPTVTAYRALTLVSRLAQGPESMSLKLEADILQRVDRILERECGRFGTSSPDSESDNLDIALRILVALITKKEGCLDRLTEKAPRVQELPDGEDTLADSKSAVPFSKLMSRLMKFMSILKKDAHATPDDEGTRETRMRGNLALLFSRVVEAQSDTEAPPCLKQLNFEPLVDILVDWLRKERGPAQQNIGTCLTRLAQNPQYRQRVRDLNGIESLHQIMLPKVNQQKEAAIRQHKLQGINKASQLAWRG
jgi:tetratricopeptide (TPR) repeat protein